MKTLVTSAVATGAEQQARRERTFTSALVAVLVVLAALTATAVLSWQGSTSQRPPAPSRVVGPDTFVGSVYDEQVPAAANPLREGSVYREQVPAAPRPMRPGSVYREQVPPFEPIGQ